MSLTTQGFHKQNDLVQDGELISERNNSLDKAQIFNASPRMKVELRNNNSVSHDRNSKTNSKHHQSPDSLLEDEITQKEEIPKLKTQDLKKRQSSY